jgi:hypothetical protein
MNVMYASKATHDSFWLASLFGFVMLSSSLLKGSVRKVWCKVEGPCIIFILYSQKCGSFVGRHKKV